MSVSSRWNYFKRIFKAYLGTSESQLTFWHGVPRVNLDLERERIGPYYMLFKEKAEYQGEFDQNGIPLLNYHGEIGYQYNPIAISQYGLGNYNLYTKFKEKENFHKFIRTANWLIDHLEKNQNGIPVWMHHFDFEYRDTLNSPWYSGLAQGQGVSVLVRAYQETKDEKYLIAADEAFLSFGLSLERGGVIAYDQNDNLWIEEYIVKPPTHILNGFIWALWGVYDYYLLTESQWAKKIFQAGVKTLSQNIHRYDIGYWSLYELSATRLKMIASPFYHQLHIVQLIVMYKLTRKERFLEYAKKWENYQNKKFFQLIALFQKVVFKLIYY